jgi:hypothetical protein
MEDPLDSFGFYVQPLYVHAPADVLRQPLPLLSIVLDPRVVSGFLLVDLSFVPVDSGFDLGIFLIAAMRDRLDQIDHSGGYT